MTTTPSTTRIETSRRRSDRPDPFSTYAPRDLVRRLKVVAILHDVPVWTVVTAALEQYLERFERDHGDLPSLDTPPGSVGP